MAKKRVNERTILFIEDYANKTKGTEMKCDVVLASQLVSLKVAEFVNAQAGDAASDASDRDTPQDVTNSKAKEKPQPEKPQSKKTNSKAK